MSASKFLRQNLVLDHRRRTFESLLLSCNAWYAAVQFSGRRGKCGIYVPNAGKRVRKQRKWWQRFFFDEDVNWLYLKDDGILDTVVQSEEGSGEDELLEDEKFEAWKTRAEAIVELREAQEDAKNGENKRWEDWLVDGTVDAVGKGASWFEDQNGAAGIPGNDRGGNSNETRLRRGLVKLVRDFVIGREDGDILYEDRVFRYASLKSAKFLVALIIVPWGLDFLVHDYVLMPFLDRYAKTVPLAAQMFDVRKNQKLEIVKVLNMDKARYRLEVEIGKSPPLSDEELYLELRKKAIELLDEWRLENRKAFANIWSDTVFGVSLFSLLYFYQNQVALLKFTGYKVMNNISDTGKAFLIILITDIFLGYHSESGWQTLLEVIIEHYGLDVDQAAITIFICLVPVIVDSCVKLWLFKFLPRLSPKVANIFQEMRRH